MFPIHFVSIEIQKATATKKWALVPAAGTVQGQAAWPTSIRPRSSHRGPARGTRIRTFPSFHTVAIRTILSKLLPINSITGPVLALQISPFSDSFLLITTRTFHSAAVVAKDSRAYAENQMCVSHLLGRIQGVVSWIDFYCVGVLVGDHAIGKVCGPRSRCTPCAHAVINIG
jgi:hypothetical protein